jgi:Flp pilus assembly protein protease CpaA
MEWYQTSYGMMLMLAVTTWAIVLCFLDLKTRRLPNVLTLGGAGVMLLVRFLESPASLTNGAVGALVAGGFLLIPFLMKGAGGGDVKMLCGAGAVVGFSRVLPMLWVTSLVGVVFGIGMICAGRMDSGRVKHMVRSLVDVRYDREAGRASLPPKSSERARMPFSVAIAVGMLWVLVVP